MSILLIIPRMSMFLVIAATLLALPVAIPCGNRASPTSTPGAAAPASTLTTTEQQSGEDDAQAPESSEGGFSRLDEVRTRGQLVCASSDAIPGFGYLEDGDNAGFDIDLCRAWPPQCWETRTPWSSASASPPVLVRPSGPER